MTNTRRSVRRATSYRLSPVHRRRSAARPSAAGAKALDGLGVQLRLARERTAITVRELARRTGVSPSLVSQVERGLATPSVGTLFAIANELGLEIGDLFKFSARSGRTAPGPVQRGNSRKAIHMASGVRWERPSSRQSCATTTSGARSSRRERRPVSAWSHLVFGPLPLIPAPAGTPKRHAALGRMPCGPSLLRGRADERSCRACIVLSS